jgi:hypothetical protein
MRRGLIASQISMKTTLILLLTTLVLSGCRDNTKLSGEQKTYEVVEEGAASGVAGTIGEAPVPLTGTNADTTTTFQLPMTASTDSAAPAVLGGTIPDPYTTTPAAVPAATATSAGYIRRSAPPVAAAPKAPATEAPRPAEGGYTSGANAEPPAATESAEPPTETEPAEKPAEKPAEEAPAPPTETTSTQPPTVS